MWFLYLVASHWSSGILYSGIWKLFCEYVVQPASCNTFLLKKISKCAARILWSCLFGFEFESIWKKNSTELGKKHLQCHSEIKFSRWRWAWNGNEIGSGRKCWPSYGAKLTIGQATVLKMLLMLLIRWSFRRALKTNRRNLSSFQLVCLSSKSFISTLFTFIDQLKHVQ